ncbi:MAG TPA: hypothetical protein VHP33_21810 [Polyangiaceae bacterium]|nr:hypothetical protein [Polyangiaceae bacterium]
MTLSRSLLRSRALFAACFALCAGGALSPGSAEAAGPKTGVVAGSGTNVGGLFTAGADGAEYVLPSLARLKVAPGSMLRVFPKSQQLQLAPGSKTTTYSFALMRGRVDVTVPSKPKSAVLCSVGKVSAVVSAGQAVIVTQGEESTVAGIEGDVRTLAAEHWTTLTPGTLSHFRGEQGSAAQPLVAAPALAAGQRLWFSPGDPIALSGFTFAKVAGAAQYDVRLQAADGSGVQQRNVRRGTRLEDPFAPVAPGQYLVSVRSIDAEGIAGPWSKPEGVSVVGVTLPPGGYSAGGDIFIGKGQEVRFSNTNGLEMTYEGLGRYVPATGAVSLYRGETTTVSFRVPGSLYPTTARLRPRGLYAHVALGPSRAVWPTDSVQIAVELRNKDGEAVPDWIELKTEVRLGIEPIEVTFTRDGNRLIGTVPPTEHPGPWVLRVEVRDQFGALLGRDFLEIAKAPPRPPSKATSARVASK